MLKRNGRSDITHMGRPDGRLGKLASLVAGAVDPDARKTPEDGDPEDDKSKDEVTCPDCGHKFVPDEKDEADDEEDDDEGELSNQDTNLDGLSNRDKFIKLNSRTAPPNRKP